MGTPFKPPWHQTVTAKRNHVDHDQFVGADHNQGRPDVLWLVRREWRHC